MILFLIIKFVLATPTLAFLAPWPYAPSPPPGAPASTPTPLFPPSPHAQCIPVFTIMAIYVDFFDTDTGKTEMEGEGRSIESRRRISGFDFASPDSVSLVATPGKKRETAPKVISWKNIAAKNSFLFFPLSHWLAHGK